MPRVHVSVEISQPASAVWSRLADLSSHTQWMQDAVAIRFNGEQRSGVGTTFECDTAFGPLKTTDVMSITEWEEGRRMAVRHSGLVSGTGAFTLVPAVTGTRMEWDEELHFPLRFGGPLGELVAKPLFTLVWKRNLKRFAELAASS